jgi:Predicted membrane protein (DUF2079)
MNRTAAHAVLKTRTLRPTRRPRIPGLRPPAEDVRASPAPLRTVRRVGYAMLALQLAGFLAWSTVLYRHFSLTADFAQYHQAWYLIAHGNLNPHDTLGRFQYWQNHAEFMMWPMALLYWVWPHCVALLWMQDIGVVTAEAIVFTWMCEIAGRRGTVRDARWLVGAGLVLLAANPWIWWGISFDFHFETIGLPFAAALARDTFNGRRRAWLWVLPLLACGDVTGTYVAAIGFGVILAGRGRRLRGLALAGAGVAAVLFITLIHGNLGSAHGLQAYAYLAVPGAKATGHLPLTKLVLGIATHPVRILAMLWTKRIDLWANLAPSGFLGLGFPPLLPLVLIDVLENNLFHGLLFSEPLFQSLPIYVFTPVATVGVLCWLARRWRWASLAVAGLLVAQAIGWAAVWGVRTPLQWLRVSDPAAATLARVDARIPAAAEVVVSQGVVGRFADHADVQALLGPGSQPVSRPDVWFVILPTAGIESQSSGSAKALVAELQGPLHATREAGANGVYVFRWHPPPSVHMIRVPGLAPIPAWTTPGIAGRPVQSGALRDWHVTSTRARGYVVSGLVWQVRPRRYQAIVRLSATGPVNVEVWDDNGTGRLLARRIIPGTDGTQTISLPVNATARYRASVYPGWGPFQATFIAPPAGQRIEVRVWTPGSSTVNVYWASLRAAG